MAGDVAATGTAAADVTQSAPEQGESPAPGQDAEVAREAATPRRGRTRPAPVTGSPAPAPAAASPASTPPAAPAATPGQAAAGSPGITGGAGVRRRLARLGAPRGGGINPVLEPLIKTVRATHPKADIRLIDRAYEVAAHWHAGQMRKSGDPYITHPLAVTTILAELGMNSDTLCAALLHDTVEDTAYTLAELRKDFGEEVAALVDGVTKLDRVKYGDAAEAETVRKMVVAMSRDIRVLVIKLADRLHNMRTLRYLAREKQVRKSQEVAGDLRPAGAPAGHEHHQVGTGRPGLRDPVPQAVRRDRPDGLRARPRARTVPPGRGRRGRLGPARSQDQASRHRAAEALLLRLPEDDRAQRRLRGDL